MAEVNYGLLASIPNAGQAFSDAFTKGQETGRQNKARAALAALAKNPSNTAALSALAEADPATAMEWRKNQLEVVKQSLAEHQDNILKGAEIIRQFQPKDQQSYTAALVAAQHAGIDVSQAPQQFDPAYVDGIVKLADAFKPQGDGNQVVVTPQPGAPAFIYDKDTGGVKQIFAPNPGGQAAGAPVGPTTASDAHGNKVQFNQQSGQWEPLGGATGSAPSQGFPQQPR